MTAEEIRTLLKATPFHQFHVCMKDGRRVFIDDPFYAKIFPGTTRLIFSPHGEVFLRLKLAEIERVEMAEPTTA